MPYIEPLPSFSPPPPWLHGSNVDRMELFTEILGPAPASSPTGTVAGNLLKAGTQPEDSCLKSMVTTVVCVGVGRHEVLVRNLVGAWVNPSSFMFM